MFSVSQDRWKRRTNDAKSKSSRSQFTVAIVADLGPRVRLIAVANRQPHHLDVVPESELMNLSRRRRDSRSQHRGMTMLFDEQLAERHVFTFSCSLWKSTTLFKCFALDEEKEPVGAVSPVHIKAVVSGQAQPR